ncbi:hypothetical protein Tco_1403223 [Tanacetum coccineum]
MISLLARGNTLQSDEDRLKLDELMALCTTLQNRVLDLEKTKTTQHNEIASLKRRVKKLEKKNSLGKDASKQWRIDAIDADEEITLVSVQNVDEEMFDVNVLDGEEVFVAEQEVAVKDVNNEVNVVEEVVEVINSAKLITDATTVSAATTTTATTITVDDITLAQALMEIKSTKPKEKGVVIQELGESTTTISSQLSFLTIIRTKAKIDVDHQLAERLQAQEQEELVNTFEDFRTELVEGKEKRAGEKLMQENAKKQKVEDDKETAELKQCLEIIPDEKEVAIDAIPLAVKSPSIVGWKIHKERRKSNYQIMRADEKSQMYTIFSHMLKFFSREDLEDLYKLEKLNISQQD